MSQPRTWPPRAAGAILVAAVLGALLAGALLGESGRALAEAGPACLFRALTGIVCPFCGMTHAAIALGAGDWAAALAHHPLSPLVLLALAWLGLRMVRGHAIGRTHAPLLATAAVWLVNLAARV